MKKLITLIFLSVLFFCLSCEKNHCNKQDVTVVKDCTGTYLQIDNKDFHVCNPEKLNSFSNGEEVEAKFTNISECNGSANDAIVCTMLHASEGWIEVQSVKKED